MIKKSIFRWFSAPFYWSSWVDISTFSYGGSAFLFQAKVNSLSNAKRFRVQPTSGGDLTANIGHVSIELLKDAGIINQKLNAPNH